MSQLILYLQLCHSFPGSIPWSQRFHNSDFCPPWEDRPMKRPMQGIWGDAGYRGTYPLGLLWKAWLEECQCGWRGISGSVQTLTETVLLGEAKRRVISSFLERLKGINVLGVGTKGMHILSFLLFLCLCCF